MGVMVVGLWLYVVVGRVVALVVVGLWLWQRTVCPVFSLRSMQNLNSHT